MSAPPEVLVVGATGFAGSHLSQLALERGARVFGLARRGAFVPGVEGRHVDVADGERLAACLADWQPDWIFHLAARLPGDGDDLAAMLRVNVEGTHHLLEAVRRTTPAARVLVAGSSSIYGQPREPARPIGEDAPLAPRSSYGVSKAAQDLLAAQCFREHGLHIVRARTFNQIGPREPQALVGAALARQVARIEAGLQPPVVRVHALEPRRDFCDVRDVVRGYWAALAHGAAGEAYNVCSGRSRSVGELAATLIALAGLAGVELIAQAPSPRGAVLEQLGDPSRLQGCGWAAHIPLETSLADLLGEWRARCLPGESDA